MKNIWKDKIYIVGLCVVNKKLKFKEPLNKCKNKNL